MAYFAILANDAGSAMNGSLAVAGGSHRIQDLVDLERLRRLFEGFTDAMGCTITLLDHPDLNPLIGTGWRDICTKFHRSHAECLARCVSRDLHLLDQPDAPGKTVIEKCQNGLVDCVLPIVIGGEHIASLAAGQLFLEPPDRDFFRRQAVELGFDVPAYLRAVDEVPVVEEAALRKLTVLLGDLASLISEMGYATLLERKRREDLRLRNLVLEQALAANSIANAEGVITEANAVTRHEEAEEALRAGESRFRGTFEQAAVGMAHVGLDGRWLRVNDRLCTIVGYDRDELLRMTFQDITHPDDLGADLQYVEEVLAGAIGTFSVEKRYIRKDGSLVWINLTVSVSRTASGQPDYFIAVVEDIDKRKQAEEERRQSEARMRLLNEMLDDAPAGIIVHDREGKLLYANENAAQIHGWSRGVFLQNELADLLPPEERSRIPTRLRQLDEAGALAFEVVHVRRDGSRFCMQAATRRVDWLGRPAILSVQTDLTDRKRTEETLRVSEEKFRTAFMTGLDAIYIATLEEGRVVDSNDRFVGVFGYGRDEVIGRTSLELGLYEDPRDRGRMVAQLKADGVVRELEVWARKKNGDRFLASLSVSILHMGDVPHILGVVRDVTAREQARAEQEKLESQLRQAQKMESIGQLAGGVAHDFNNMLSVILSYAGFAIESLHEGDPLLADLAEVKRAGERAAALTRQLLAFSRKQILQPEPLDVGKVVSGIEKMLRRLLGEDIEIDVRLAEGLGSVMADPGQLEQILMNLVVNARDAMPRGGKLTIETSNVHLDEHAVSAHGSVKPGRYVMLAVTDTGCGMDAAVRERIFEPFFTTKGLGKGTGLGLSTVYGIVKQSGGDISVYSELEHGTAFKVYLPRVDVLSPGATRKGAPVANIGDETVLVVEDEDAVRKIAARILQGAGYKVLAASSGAEALVLCEKSAGTIHLLLTDVIMPQMSGPELAERLAQTIPALKVLFMSGYTDDAIANHGILAPGTRFVSKPFSAAELTRKVRQALDEA